MSSGHLVVEMTTSCLPEAIEPILTGLRDQEATFGHELIFKHLLEDQAGGRDDLLVGLQLGVALCGCGDDDNVVALLVGHDGTSLEDVAPSLACG